MRQLHAALCLVLSGPAAADVPQVIEARIEPGKMGWTVTVTLGHPDTGWDHYASGWSVELADGTNLGYRELSHPHVEEQPFTRSLKGVDIPEGTAYLLIRPRCNLVGWSAEPTRIDIPAGSP